MKASKSIRNFIGIIIGAVYVITLFTISSHAATLKTNEMNATVTRDEKFNAAIVSITPEEFKELGFNLGDSCDIFFENGKTIKDVPFYNGYYVQNGAPVIVAYPGASNISITYNNLGIWYELNLKDNEKVDIRLNVAGKYKEVQEALGQVYSFDRTDYDNDVQFCNFRALNGGNLKKNFIYRGASPVDNSRGRAAYTDKLLTGNGIKMVVDLADSKDDITGYISAADFNSGYTRGLYENGQMATLDMGSAYQSKEYQQSLVKGLRQMMDSDGPVYIHCMEGKDRTGFVCMLLEALAGASYEEMRDDYMTTYKNYYNIDSEISPEKYEAVSELYFNAFTRYLLDTDDMTEMRNASYVNAASEYLMEGGMSKAEVQQLIKFMSE